ncbi:phospholipid phosphatase 5 isoform X3 [Achroia grisella]|uniref:phospholipid phosphatase 5 isoform X3 n=1 Tax=Achroia grisella TaxID=688607 RepID=UPI0027D2703C|nr:phospholipid phosphatase 5 isoform X3 [Achroia grisella]
MPLIRSASFNLFIEILVRIVLLSTFCYMETMAPFVRVIHESDLETEYKYPRQDSYVPGGALWAIVLSVPFTLSLLAWAACNDCNDALEILLAWSLALGINGVLTDTMKLIAGRPRPDFFYRCFPDGVNRPYLQCTGDPLDIMEGRKSFPSGHSSYVLVGSILGYTVAIFCYRQYYNPLSSDLAGIPYVVSNLNLAKYVSGKPDVSPVKGDSKELESTPLLNGRKEDKWI